MSVGDGSVAYVELYVRDAVAALRYFTGSFAFTAHAFAERPDSYSVLLASGSARLVVTEPRGGGAVADWLRVHGDGVRDIALIRPDLDAMIPRVRQAGLPVVQDSTLDAGTGTRFARVGGVGSLCHTLLGDGPGGDLPPGFDWCPLRPITTAAPTPNLKSIDHVAICLPRATLYETVAAYHCAFDLRIVRINGGETDSVGLRDAAGLMFAMSGVDTVADRTTVKVVFRTDDLDWAARELRTRGVELADPTETYCRSGGVRHQMSLVYPHVREAMSFVLIERRGHVHNLRGGRCHVSSGQ